MAKENQLKEAQMAMEYAQYLADLASNPGAFLTYAVATGQPGVVQNFMPELLYGQNANLQAGDVLPGWEGPNYQTQGQPMGQQPTGQPTGQYTNWGPTQTTGMTILEQNRINNPGTNYDNVQRFENVGHAQRIADLRRKVHEEAERRKTNPAPYPTKSGTEEVKKTGSVFSLWG
jgi:hypothetical protein